jgi:hypothetical protein
MIGVGESKVRDRRFGGQRAEGRGQRAEGRGQRGKNPNIERRTSKAKEAVRGFLSNRER